MLFTLFFSGKDTSYEGYQLDLKTQFESRQNAATYINELARSLAVKGFAAASVDSVFYDSTGAMVSLHLGQKFKWLKIIMDSADKKVLEKIGWNEKTFENRLINFSAIELEQKKIVGYFENNGYPFAQVYLQNFDFKNSRMIAELKIIKGPLYHIDSIRVYGKVKIRNLFLQHYLGIFKGSKHFIREILINHPYSFCLFCWNFISKHH